MSWFPIRKVWAAIWTALLLAAAAGITTLAGDPGLVDALGPFAVPVGAALAALAAYMTRRARKGQGEPEEK